MCAAQQTELASLPTLPLVENASLDLDFIIFRQRQSGHNGSPRPRFVAECETAAVMPRTNNTGDKAIISWGNKRCKVPAAVGAAVGADGAFQSNVCIVALVLSPFLG